MKSLRAQPTRILDLIDKAPRRREQPASSRRSSPNLEPLEKLELLSTVQTLVEPTATVGPSLTNFGPPSSLPALPLSPAIPLFDPNLGTLVAVHINGAAQVASQIGIENLSRTSGDTYAPSTQGQFLVNGLGTAPIQGSFSATVGQPGQESPFHATAFDGTIDFGGASGHTFNAVGATSAIATTITDPAQLAAFLAGPGRTTVTPTLAATAQSHSNDSNGNDAVSVATQASAALTVSYDYIATPPNVSVALFGIHHQQSQIFLSLTGAINAAEAANPANYQLVTRGHNGQFGSAGSHAIAVGSAAFDPTTQTAVLLPTQHLNFHKHFQLTVKAPVFNNSNGLDLVTVFGGKQSLAGFFNHKGQVVRVQNGHRVK